MAIKHNILLAAGCSLAALSCGASHAFAADAAAPATGGEQTVDEVVVTADKRAERLLEVPSSVTAVTNKDFQEIGAASLQDYVAKIPGLTVSNVSMVNGSNQLVIRGLTTGVGGNPTVGIYVDDSPFGASNGFGGFTVPDLDPQDLARVEVLRGPQGTLYGAGSLGGLLKYVTATPDPSHFFGRMEVDGSTVNGGGQGYAVRASVNMPVNDKLAVRLSGYDREDPGYVDNVMTGQDNVDDTRFYGGRASIGWQVNDNWKVRVSALYQSQSGAGPIVDYNPITFQPTYGDLKQSRGINTGIGTQHIGAYTVEVEGDLGGFATLTSSTAYNKQTMLFNIDATNLYGPLIGGIFGVPNLGAAITTVAGLDKFTQEVRLASPAENRLTWQLGGFYTHERDDSVQNLPTFNPLTGTPITGLPLLLVNHLNNVFEEEAVFGDATYHFNPLFDITGGLRYSHNKQDGGSVTDGLLIGPSNTIGSSSDNSVTYLITPRFHLTPDTMIYGRVATGYRPGGPNPLGGTPGVPSSFGPDKVTNYEVGIKSDLLDHRATVELAAYWIDWTNIQVQEITPLGVSYIDNAAAALSRGVEATGSWRPIDGLEIAANVTYIDAHLTQDMPAGSGAVGKDGDRLPLTPSWSSALGADYAFPLIGQWTGHVGADWRHVGQTQGAFPNPGLPRFVHPAYDTVDLRAGVSNDRWNLTFFAKNIGDSRGQLGDVALGDTRVSIIQPRTFAVSLSTSF